MSDGDSSYGHNQEEVFDGIRKRESLRRDTLRMKNKLANLLGDRGKEYWTKFKNFISGKCTKKEFDAIVLRALRRGEYVKLHNELVLAIIYNASKKLYPPTTHHKDAAIQDPFILQADRKAGQRMGTRAWNEKFTLRIIKSFSKKDYLRLVKLSQTLPRTPPRDNVLYKDIYSRECSTLLSKRAETVLSGPRKLSKLCEESGMFPSEESVRETQLFYSFLESFSHDKESRGCISLMLLGAKYMVKNYISRVLVNSRTAQESDKESTYRIAVLNKQISDKEPMFTLNQKGNVTRSTDKEIPSIHKKKSTKDDDKKKQDPVSWYCERVSEMYKRKTNILTGHREAFNNILFGEDENLLSRPITNSKGNFLDPFCTSAVEARFGAEKTGILHDMDGDTALRSMPPLQGHTSSRPSTTLTQEKSLIDPALGSKYVNIPTPFSIEKITHNQFSFVSLDNDQAQSTSSQAPFDLKNTGISSLSSVNTFNKLLLQSDPVIVQKHVNINGNLGFKTDKLMLLSLEDLRFRSYLDLHILAPSYATMRLLDSVQSDTDILDTDNELGDDIKNFVNV